MIGYAVHLLANAVHPSEAPDAHDVGYAVHFRANVVTPGRLLLDIMAYAVHLMANVHHSEAPHVHSGKCRAISLDSKCSTLDT